MGRGRPRGSRRSSPKGVAPRSTPKPVQPPLPPQQQPTKQQTSIDGWVEPPLANLLPSYQETDPSAERNMSTAQMQPLGKLPPTKSTTKVIPGKRGPGRPPNKALTSTSAKLALEKEATQKQSITKSTSNPVPAPLPPTFVWPTIPDMDGEDIPNSRTPAGQARLSMVVDAAVERSAFVGNMELGRAIRKLHEDSMTNPDLANLLDVVLAQRATLQQTQAFQAYIRMARESLAAEEAEKLKRLKDAEDGIEENGAMDQPAEDDQEEGEAVPAKRRRGRPKKNAEVLPTVLKRPTRRNPSVDSERSSESFGSPFGRTTRTTTRPGSSAGSSTMADVSYFRPDDDDGDETLSEGEGTGPRTKKKGITREKLPPDSELIKYSYVRKSPSPTSPSTGEKLPKRGRGRKRARSNSPTRVESDGDDSFMTNTTNNAPTTQSGPPTKKRATRVKSSPLKAKTNTYVIAGISTSQNMDSRELADPSENISDNDDFCSACGGTGTVICCDRCPLSFHYTCVNPPLDTPGDDDSSWFCNKCQAAQKPPPPHPRSLFSDFLNSAERRNPAAYQLPKDIQLYYDGVGIGKNGEYIETTDMKAGKTRLDADMYRLQTKEGQAMLCFKCGGSPLGHKAILKCDFCPLYWHIDCLDPPPANPPHATRKWMCPAHVEQHFKARRPRQAMVKTTYLQRGHRNNGIIEIENEPDQEDPRFYEETIKGVVYRLPERGIKLDFVEKVKQKNGLASSKSSVRMRTTESSRAQSVDTEALFTTSELEAAVVLGNLVNFQSTRSLNVAEEPLNESQMTDAVDESNELERLLAARREMDRRIEELTSLSKAKKTPEPVATENTQDKEKELTVAPDLVYPAEKQVEAVEKTLQQSEEAENKLRDTVTVDLGLPDIADTNSDDFEEAYNDLV